MECRNGLAHPARRGRRAGHVREGFPGTREILVSLWKSRLDRTLRKGPGSVQADELGAESEAGVVETVSVEQGNEGRRDGREEVGAPHSTDETGELCSRGPSGGKEVAVCWILWRER